MFAYSAAPARTAGASMSFPVASSSLTSTARSAITRPPARRLLGLVRDPAGLKRFMPPAAVVSAYAHTAGATVGCKYPPDIRGAPERRGATGRAAATPDKDPP